MAVHLNKIATTHFKKKMYKNKLCVAKSIKYYINGHNLLNNKGTKMIKVSLEPQESPARNDCVTFIDIVHFRVF